MTPEALSPLTKRKRMPQSALDPVPKYISFHVKKTANVTEKIMAFSVFKNYFVKIVSTKTIVC